MTIFRAYFCFLFRISENEPTIFYAVKSRRIFAIISIIFFRTRICIHRDAVEPRQRTWWRFPGLGHRFKMHSITIGDGDGDNMTRIGTS